MWESADRSEGSVCVYTPTTHHEGFLFIYFMGTLAHHCAFTVAHLSCLSVRP